MTLIIHELRFTGKCYAHCTLRLLTDFSDLRKNYLLVLDKNFISN